MSEPNPANPPMTSDGPFVPGTLRGLVTVRRQAALACGALVPISTRERVIDDPSGRCRCVVRVADNLRRKAATAARSSTRRPVGGSGAGSADAFNPFLPWDPDLFVADVGDAHAIVFNKFNVLDDHLLVVTRAFEPQEGLLTPGDFLAWFRCLGEFPSLGFYNGGTAAGASQRHKHLQVVPIPISRDSRVAPVPIEPLLRAGGIGLPASVRVREWAPPPGMDRDLPERAAAVAHAFYRSMLAEAGIGVKEGPEGIGPVLDRPHNLVLTERWILLAPRRRECFVDISVNGLGFAGSFFVRDEAAMRRIEEAGPLAVLRAVCE